LAFALESWPSPALRAGKQRGFVDDVGELGAAAGVSAGEALEIDAVPSDLRTSPADLLAAFEVGHVDHDLAVEAAGAGSRDRDVGRSWPRAGSRLHWIEASIRRACYERLLALACPTAEAAPRWRPTASISVDEDDARRVRLACSNRSPRARRRSERSSTKSDPTSRRTAARLAATALASSVLPVPGGPTSSAPLGSRRRPLELLRVLQKSMISSSSCFASSQRDVGEGDLGVSPASSFAFDFAEGKRGFHLLHLPQHEDHEAEDQEVRQN